MAIIYSYPAITDPQLSDLLLVTDVSSSDPKNQTKTMTLQQVADLVDDEVTLQEVLNASDPGNTPPTASATGNIVLSGNMTLTNLAVNGTANFVGLATFATVDINGGTIDNTTVGGSVAAPGSFTNLKANDAEIGNVAALTGNPDLKVGNSIKFGGGIGTQNAFTIGSEYDGVGGNPSDFNGPYIQFGSGASAGMSAVVQGTGALTLSRASGALNTGDIVIGGNSTVQMDLTATATGGVIDVTAAEGINLLNTTSGDITIQNSANPGQITLTPFTGNEIVLNGRTNAVSYVDFQANNGIRLNGVAGTNGQLIQSKGSGAPLEWIDSSDLSVENLIEAVENNTGSLIPKGAPVHIAANPSGTPRVEPADAAVPSTMPASGLAYEDIPAGVGQPGEMIIAGQLEGINTVPFGLGSVVYVNTAGGVGTRPVGPTNLVQNVGIVTKAAANGILQVTAIGRTNDLPNNDANALFAASSTGTPISTTGKFEVDVSGNSMLIGDNTGATDITINSNNFRGEVKNDTAAGIENLQIGYQSLEQAMINGGTAQSNVAVGIRSMQGTFGTGLAASGSYNVAVGNDTLNSNSNLFALVTGNTAIGHQALQGGPTNIADYNTAVGYQSLINLAGVTTGTADNNTAVGAFSLFNVTSGGENTSIGVGAGQAIITGNNNTFVGHQSGTSTTTLTNGTAIGQNADVIADGGTALGQDSIVQAPGSIALGKGAVAANPNTININVANINGVQPSGGLFVTNAGAPPAGLTPGDVYVLDAAAATNTTGHNLLCIMP